MGQARRRRRSEGLFNIHRSFRLNAKQQRTLQMYTDRFDLLNEGEAIRHMIDNYMEPELEAAMSAETAALAAKTSPTASKISTPPAIAAAPKKHWAPKPAIQTVDTDEVASDDGMRPPIVSIRGPAIARVLEENEDQDPKARVARYEPDQDRYGSIEQD